MSGHDHTHGVHHAHEHGREGQAPHGGPVVFDIGGDVGALIMYVDDELEGTEVPLEWDLDPSKDVHTGVWRRGIGGDSVVVAVYPELLEGRYLVPALGGHDVSAVDIVGGRVAELDVRSQRASYV